MTDSEEREIRVAFAQESAEMLAGMRAALQDLDAECTDAGAFARLYRFVHTIKGSAGIVGIGEVEQFAGIIEAILVRMKETHHMPDREFLALLGMCHDQICNMLVNTGDGISGEKALLDGLMVQLDRLVSTEGDVATVQSRKPDQALNTAGPFGFFE